MATRTKKSGQRKALVAGLAAFASVCLIATGFAAWVISAKAEEKKTGNVNIGTVSSADVKITVNQDTNDDGALEGVAFSFNPEKEDTTGRVRNDGKNFESMKADISGTVGPQRFVTSFTVQLDILKEETTGSGEEQKTEWVVDTEGNERFKKAETDGFITVPTCLGEAKELVGTENYVPATADQDGKAVANFNYSFAFGWGSKFKGVNPGKYYDDVEEGKKVSDADVSKTLNDFYFALTGKEAPKDDTTSAPDAEFKFLITLTADTAKKEGSSKVGN